MRLHAKLHLQLVVPFHLLLVVVVGRQGDRAHHGVVALSSLIPVAREIVLHELQVVVASEVPEVRLEYHEVNGLSVRLLWKSLFYNLRRAFLYGLWLYHGSGCLKASLRVDDQLWVIEIKGEQRAVGVAKLLVNGKGVARHVFIERERQEVWCRLHGFHGRGVNGVAIQ